MTTIVVLTWQVTPPVCDASDQQAISGAVLAEEQDQDALVNRAIIEKATCENR